MCEWVSAQSRCVCVCVYVCVRVRMERAGVHSVHERLMGGIENERVRMRVGYSEG